MTSRRRIFAGRWRRLGKRLTREDGVVIVIVLAVMAIALMVGAALLAESLSSNRLTTNSMRERRAQQAAQAGIQAELYDQGENQAGASGSGFDLNGGLLGLGTFLDCVEPQFNGSLQITGLVSAGITSNGNCPGGGTGSSTLVPEPVGNHAYYESEFFPGASSLISGDSEVELQPKIVSLGYDNTDTAGTGSVYSREEAVLSPVEPLPVLGGNDSLKVSGVSLSLSGLLLSTLLSDLGVGNLATTINGDVEAAQNVTLPSIDASLGLSLTNGLLGVVQYGGSLSPTNGFRVAQVLPTAPPPEQPVTVSTGTPSCPSTNANCASFGTYYNATTDSVTIPAGGTTTIPGGEYVFCNFNAQGTVTANPSSTVPVQIFIDNPNSPRCTSGNGSPVLSSTANSVTGHDEDNDGNFIAVQGVSNGPLNVTGVLGPSGLQVYDVGDDPQASSPYDDDTYVQIGNPSQTGTDGGLLTTNLTTEEAVVYAPTSEVSMTTAKCVNLVVATVCVPGAFTGNLIGDDVNATALTFTQDLDLGNYPLYDGIELYHVKEYLPCTPVSTLTGIKATDTNGC